MLELDGGAGVGVEAPAALDGSGEEDGLGLRLDGRWSGRGRLVGVGEGVWCDGGLERFGIAEDVCAAPGLSGGGGHRSRHRGGWGCRALAGAPGGVLR